MSKTVKLDDEVLDVLNRSEITETAVKLPEQLDRGLYMKLAKVLKAAGGKWNTKAKATLFQDDPREALGLALETGEIENEQQVRQAFYTPDDLATRMLEEVGHVPNERLLEPSAGKGAIAGPASTIFGWRYILAIDNDPKAIEALHLLSTYNAGLHVQQGDFLLCTPDALFDAVVMNPPFTGYQELEHVRHAWKFLKPGGCLVSVMTTAMTFRTDRKYTDFHDWRCLAASRMKTIGLDPGTFKTAGTGVNTLLLVMDKPE